jgi:hypothetical protein
MAYFPNIPSRQINSFRYAHHCTSSPGITRYFGFTRTDRLAYQTQCRATQKPDFLQA